MASVPMKFPAGFSPQTTGLSAFASLMDRPAEQVVAYFVAHPIEADAVLGQSYDKRYSPSTFVEEIGNRFQVGWFNHSRQEVQVFDTLAEAVTDYLMFSFGKGRLPAKGPAK